MSKITNAEQAICELLTSNPYMENSQIAAALEKSEKTVENQLRSIYSKLDIDGTAFQKRLRLADWLRGYGEYESCK